MKKYIILTITLFIFAGCSAKTNYTTYPSIEVSNHVHNNLLSTIDDISEQLFSSKNEAILKDGLITTSFVSLGDLKKTTPLGKILSESMIDELHTKGFKVVDFRGRDSVIVNRLGEFYITREAAHLKDEIENANILVGTYTAFDQNSTLINIRILHFETGEVLASAKVVYIVKDCELLNNCPKVKPIKKVIPKIIKKPIKKIVKPSEHLNIIKDTY